MAAPNLNEREYRTYAKPSWAPPSWLFAPVWTVLYIIMAITFGFVFYQATMHAIEWSLALPFLFNLVFNAAFTPIQFRLKNNYLAALDIILVLATLAWALIGIYPVYPWVAFANIPYLAWVCFAAVLQLTVTSMNA